MRARKRKGALLHAPIPFNSAPSVASQLPGFKLISWWLIAPGATRIQTRSALVAEQLRRLKDVRQVGESVAGGYLRLFDSGQPPGKLRKTLNRIERRIKGAFLPKQGFRKSPVNAPQVAGSIRMAGGGE
jgi:hypothetical protein